MRPSNRVPRVMLSVLLGTLAALFSSVAHGQSPDAIWSPLLPMSRTMHSAIYDPIRDRMLVYGGYLGEAGVADGDVWEFSFGSSGAWKRLPTTGEIPRPSTFIPPFTTRSATAWSSTAVHRPSSALTMSGR